ncbi:creatininase family protein [Amnibacterium sp.]|uniref:creatininase family protein n=1 Tax=Amnibacterium sp. TaxID=1872496 RepID=UPI00262B21C1|nr:creatininase family protein [Amnibacterium sp.]MCU1472338.1 Creatinine amidohydrolase [Amnibacterium sp.]
MSRLLADLPGSRVAPTLTGRSVLVQPIGAIEHHGPHLPLRTDALVAEAVTTAAVERAADAGLDVWQLPTLSVSKSDEHAWAPGTLWLSADTLLDVLRDIGRAVAATPAKKLVFVNGHGGNVALLQVVNRELRRRYGLQPFTMPAGLQQAGRGVDGEPDERGFGIHAGWAETSLVLHLAPDLVHPEEYARNVPDALADFRHLGFNGRPVTFGWLSNDFGPSGVIGDPTGATAEAGARLFDDGVAFVAEALAEVDRYPLLPA